MKKVIAAIAVVFASAFLAHSAAPTTSAARPADLCRGAIDPLDAGAERARFFAAAGADNELSAAEAAAPNSFMRPFDHFQAMLAFDKNGNRTIDWFEAEAYRQNVRQRVLKQFDADKDGQLVGSERDAANAVLAKGPLTVETASSRPASAPADSTAVSRDGTPPGATSQPADPQRQERMAEQRRQMRESQRQFQLRHFDADGDGQLSQQEKQQSKAFEQSLQQIGNDIRKQWTNDDDEQQRQALQDAGRRLFAKIAAQYADQGPDAMMAIGRQFQQGMQAWMERMIETYGGEGGGMVNESNRQTIVNGMKDYFDQRCRACDADHDNQLNADEASQLLEDFAREVGVLR